MQTRPRVVIVGGGISGLATAHYLHRLLGAEVQLTLVEGAGLRVERLETFRFQLMWPLGRSPLQRALNRLDERLPTHGVGDIVVVVARKP